MLQAIQSAHDDVAAEGLCRVRNVLGHADHFCLI